MKKLPALLLSLLLFSKMNAQIGGRYGFEFLNLTSSPKVAALGGKYISHVDDDLSVTYHNPSLLNESMDKHISLSFVNYFAGIKYGYASYARRLTDHDNIAVGVQYISYGTFVGADEVGTQYGNFTAGEYALNLIFSHKIDSFFTFGGDIRNIFSVLEQYQSYGISTDWGLTYNNSKDLMTLALVVRNLGTQVTPYITGTYDQLPLEVQLGFTKQLRYAPFRFSITAQHLEKPDMSVTDFSSGNTSESASTLGTSPKKSGVSKVADQTMRHLIFGVELLPFKDFYLRFGYNYQRRQELKILTSPGMVGFSWGFGLSVSSFQLNYGRATYHLSGGATNHFSIATNLSRFSGKHRKGPVTSENL